MKETWESVKAIDAFLKRKMNQYHPLALVNEECLQPSPDVNITTRNFCRPEENMSTIATRTGDFHGVLAAVRSGGVKTDDSALVTVCCICRPCRLVPSLLEVLRDLGEREGKECGGEKNSLMKQHYDSTSDNSEYGDEIQKA